MTTPQLLLADALGHPSSDKRIDILRRIGQVGSISEAARGAGVSYRAAWQALDTLSNLAGLPLLEKLVGGAGGGGARLTPAGLRLLEARPLHATTQPPAAGLRAPWHMPVSREKTARGPPVPVQAHFRALRPGPS